MVRLAGRININKWQMGSRAGWRGLAGRRLPTPGLKYQYSKPHNDGRFSSDSRNKKWHFYWFFHCRNAFSRPSLSKEMKVAAKYKSRSTIELSGGESCLGALLSRTTGDWSWPARCKALFWVKADPERSFLCCTRWFWVQLQFMPVPFRLSTGWCCYCYLTLSLFSN